MIRNEKGEVMAAIAERGGAVQDSEEVEVMACGKALEFAIDAGFTEIGRASCRERVCLAV